MKYYFYHDHKSHKLVVSRTDITTARYLRYFGTLEDQENDTLEEELPLQQSAWDFYDTVDNTLDDDDIEILKPIDDIESFTTVREWAETHQIEIM